MYLGKSVRMERIFNRNTERTIIVPLDHGVSVGPIFGIIDLRVTVDKVAEGGANAVSNSRKGSNPIYLPSHRGGAWYRKPERAGCDDDFGQDIRNIHSAG